MMPDRLEAAALKRDDRGHLHEKRGRKRNGHHLTALNDAAAEHAIPTIKDRRLSGTQRPLRLVKLNLHCPAG